MVRGGFPQGYDITLPEKKEFNFYIFRKYVPAVRSNLTKFMFNLSEWCQVILSLKGKCTGETLV